MEGRLEWMMINLAAVAIAEIVIFESRHDLMSSLVKE